MHVRHARPVTWWRHGVVSVWLFVFCVCLSVCLSVCQSVSLSVCPCLSVCPYLSVCLSLTVADYPCVQLQSRLGRRWHRSGMARKSEARAWSLLLQKLLFSTKLRSRR